MKISPIASMTTDRVGYHASGTGLVIGFGAFKKEKKKKKMKLKDRENGKPRNCVSWSIEGRFIRTIRTDGEEEQIGTLFFSFFSLGLLHPPYRRLLFDS